MARGARRAHGRCWLAVTKLHGRSPGRVDKPRSASCKIFDTAPQTIRQGRNPLGLPRGRLEESKVFQAPSGLKNLAGRGASRAGLPT